MDKTSQNGGNPLFNGDVSDNNNSVAYQTSISASHSMINEKDATKGSDCTEPPGGGGASGNAQNYTKFYSLS